MAELQEMVIHPAAAAERGDDANNAAEEPDEEDRKLELTVDEIIEEHVGPLGFSQLLHVFLVSIAWIFEAHHTLVTIFSDAQPSWRCSSSASSFCSPASSLCSLDREAWEWIGGNKSSSISEWGLICQHRFRAGIPASVFFLGSLFGSVAYGRLADGYIGRKKTILISCLFTSLTAFLTSFSPNLWVYAALRFANGFARSGIGICCIVLSTESVGRRWRGQVGQYGFFLFTLGFLSLPLIAYSTRHSWRLLYRLLSVPPIAYSLLLLIPFVSESPRWLAIHGRTRQALSILSHMAKLNGRIIPDNITISAPTSDTSSNQRSLWSVGWTARRMLTTMLAGLGIGFVYYGVQLNVENLNFNLYFTVAVNAVMEVPAVFLGSVLLSVVDRRILFFSSAFAAGASCIICLVLGKVKRNKGGRGSWVELVVEAVGFMAATMAFNTLYVFCVELFATNVRNFAVSMLRQGLMLGAAVAPVMVVVGRFSPALSFVIFGGFAVASGCLAFLLPETRHAPLYETLEQQEKEEKLGTLPAPHAGQ